MQARGKIKIGKKYSICLGRNNEWVLTVIQKDKHSEEFSNDAFDLYFITRISQEHRIKTDPNTFTEKMEELGWKRKRGSVFIREQLNRRELEMVLEKVKLLILAIEKTKRLTREIHVNELFHFLKKNDNSDGPRTFLSEFHTTQICQDIVSNLDDFARHIMLDNSVTNQSIVFL